MDPARPFPVIPIRPVPVDRGTALPAATGAPQATIYMRSVRGWFATWRWVLVGLTQAFFYGVPWLTWNGRQALLFDLEAQRFFIGALVLYPQDLIYLAALLVLSALALFLFTAVAGRLWCGYACPQTVYTEMFMAVQRRVEGDRSARMRLDRSPWGVNKLVRKGTTQTAWVAISLVTGFTFVGYFTPIRELAQSVMAFAVSPWNLFWIAFYALATYGNAGFLREQMCKYICPYARFQSALIDKDSLIITYDRARGEPRGARTRQQSAAALGVGDCIDCTLCVQVCPTGIDIRHGLQNECIGCAACIDACNGVMDKVGSPRGLIRYATENGMAQGWTRGRMFRRALRPRVLVYGMLLLLAASAFVASLTLRSPFRFDVIRDRGALARIVDDGVVENVYRLQVMNRSERPQRYHVAVVGPSGLQVQADPVEVAPTGIQSVVARVRLPPQAASSLAGRSIPIAFELRSDPTGASAPVVQHEDSTFFVPR